jgi:hypothetical protein
MVQQGQFLAGVTERLEMADSVRVLQRGHREDGWLGIACYQHRVETPLR